MAQLKNPPVPGTSDDLQRLLALIRKFDTAMLVTHTADGECRARPMAIADVSDTGDLWFATRIQAPKVDEMQKDERVLVVMQNASSYLSVSGHSEMRKDPAMVQKLWSESWRIWFKDKHDPDILLIHVTPHEGEFWDQSGVKGVKYILRAAKAYATGKQLPGSEFDPEQHAKVRL